MRNKKGYSTGFTWVFGLLTIFGLGLLYIVFNEVLTAYYVPVIKAQVNTTYPMMNPIDNVTKAEIYSNIDRYMAFFNTMPYVLFFVVVVYMILAAVRKEREGEMQ